MPCIIAGSPATVRMAVQTAKEVEAELIDNRIALYTPAKVLPHLMVSHVRKGVYIFMGLRLVISLQTGVYGYKLTEVAVLSKSNLHIMVSSSLGMRDEGLIYPILHRCFLLFFF